MNEFAPHPAPKKSSSLPWILVALLAAVAVLAIVLGWLPASTKGEQLETRVQQLEGELTQFKEATAKVQGELNQLKEEREKLSRQKSEAQTQLEQALKEKEAALEELAKAKTDLSETLATQIAAGDIFLRDRKGDLVVDVADKLLFDKGDANVSEDGKKLLLNVAKSLRKLPGSITFQVGGHTDSQRVVSKELVELYPTNWELSTSRATNVVRYLQEAGGVPGKRLVAAGFSQYRPASSNRTEAGRQKNRRIEIILLLPK